MYDTADIIILENFFGYEGEDNEIELYKKLMTSFLKYKTVLLVTKSPHILEQVDKILLVGNKTVKEFPNLEML